MAADPVLCETSPDSPVQVYEYVVVTPIVSVYIQVFLSILLVGETDLKLKEE